MSNSDQATTCWLPERYSLSHQTAVVTGGAKGIGAAIVRELMALGCRVVVWDLDVSAVEIIPGKLDAIAVDVTSQEAIEAAEARTAALIGSPDILVNNAGIQGPTVPLQDYERTAWDRVIAVNLTAVYAVTRIFVPGMKKRQSGRIINIASVAGIRGLTDGSAYGAS